MNRRNDIIVPDDIKIFADTTDDDKISLLIDYPSDKYSKDFINSIVDELINNDPDIVGVYVGVHSKEGE